jgi:hypothetical protein
MRKIEPTKLAARALARGPRWLDKIFNDRTRLKRPGSRYPSKLNLGCGHDHLEGYLNVDVDPLCSPDLLIVDGDDSAIPRGYFTEVFAQDVLEHIPHAQTLDALLNFADYLADGGKLILRTSSIVHVAAKLLSAQRYADHVGWTICLFGTQQHPGDFHYTGFTAVTLQTDLIAAGFTIEKMELRSGWLFHVEARKTLDWTSTVESTSGLTDLEFLQRAYQIAFYRDIDEGGILSYGKKLREGLSRKHALKEIFSAPERAHRIAERNEQLIDGAYAVALLPTIHNGARVAKLTAAAPSLPIAVETDEAMWSYAVSFDLDPLPSLDRAGERRVVVDLEVEAGAIGVGCTTAGYSSYIDREVFVSSGTRRKVYLPIGAPLAASHLMFRNVSPGGRSVARIHAVENRHVSAAELGATVPSPSAA